MRLAASRHTIKDLEYERQLGRQVLPREFVVCRSPGPHEVMIVRSDSSMHAAMAYAMGVLKYGCSCNEPLVYPWKGCGYVDCTPVMVYDKCICAKLTMVCRNNISISNKGIEMYVYINREFKRAIEDEFGRNVWSVIPKKSSLVGKIMDYHARLTRMLMDAAIVAAAYANGGSSALAVLEAGPTTELESRVVAFTAAYAAASYPASIMIVNPNPMFAKHVEEYSNRMRVRVTQVTVDEHGHPKPR